MLTPTSCSRTAADPVGTGRSRRAGRRAAPVLAAAAALAAAPLTAAPGHAATSVQRSPVVVLQAAGDQGGGILRVGATFPSRSAGAATLKRGSDWLQVDLQTSGLPPGAYTVWWVMFNEPSGCSAPCDVDDLLNPDAETTVFWATGGVVGGNGVATFRDRHHVPQGAPGEVTDARGDPGTQDVLGSSVPLQPKTAEVHDIVKYHGPASSDPAVLHEQTHTLLGSCGEGANAVDLGDPFGVHCFDPQAVVFPAP